MRRIEVQGQGFVGTLFDPAGNTKFPAVVVLPGSDGGIPETYAQKLAEQNYVVLALGYFGLEGLPESLENIPLEYFEMAFEWLKKHPSVKSDKIGLIGYSRGGELALLLGSLYPQDLSAIVAYAPSSVICGGFPYPNRPAWTHHGKPLPFLPGLMSSDENLSEADDLEEATKEGKIPFHANTPEDPFTIADLFLAKVDGGRAFEDATIHVENISCPVLLISGEDDKIWPSDLFARRIMDRLDQKKSVIERKHLSYRDAGHGILSPYEEPIFHPTGKFWCILGGTPEANVRAHQEAWQEVLRFLRQQRR